MTISFVCPDSFKDYDFIKKELNKLVGITRIICATSNATRLIKAYVSEHGSIEYGHEKRGGKLERMRRIIKDSDEVLLIEFTDYDAQKTGFSRTQESLKEAQKRAKKLYFFEYDRSKEPMYKDKAKLLDAINHFCRPLSCIYAKRYVHPLSQALPEFRDDKEVVLYSVERHGFSFDFASRALQNDKKMAIEVTKLHKESLPYISEKLRNSNEVKNILAQDERIRFKYENATSLFRERQEIRQIDKFRHSESRWSSIAQMAFIWMTTQSDMSMKVYKSKYNTDKKIWLEKERDFLIDNWKISNSIVEGQIKDLFPNQKDIPDMKPDITLLDKQGDSTKIILIEVKTVGAGVKTNLKKYKALQDFINEIPGYECSYYYLMSYGHEDKDWGVLDDSNDNILLWEDLLLKISDSPIMEYISLDGECNKFCVNT